MIFPGHWLGVGFVAERGDFAVTGRPAHADRLAEDGTGLQLAGADLVSRLGPRFGEQPPTARSAAPLLPRLSSGGGAL
jgi:hypothetical protein